MTWLLALVLLIAAGGFGWPAWQRHRARQAELAAPFPAAWRGLLARRLPQYPLLTPEQQTLLERHVQQFLVRKRFHGCNGLEVSEPMRVLIAGMACLLLLRPDARVYPRLHSVLVYPEAFWVRHHAPDELGLVSDDPELRLGESWGGDRVILSWDDVEAALAGDAVNVVAHEFAHQLDDENPDHDGSPPLPDYREWSRVMRAAYDELCSRGSPVLDDYGAEGPAEFYAVATETYFQRGAELERQHPELYALLRGFYGLETARLSTRSA